jgi:hypothetical protein
MDGGKWRRLTQPGLAIDRRIKLLKNLSGYVLPPGDRRATGFQFVIAARGSEGAPIFAGKSGERFQLVEKRQAAERLSLTIAAPDRAGLQRRRS